jgi:phytoene dehydrogenase-like protein
MATREGFQWTEPDGLQAGIPCLGAIHPTTNIKSDRTLYDVIVIGAGYTGLTAARDLATTGHEVLLVEARDRIGGRTWSSNLGGYPFEMGGTWVHWFQPFVYREIARYGMAKDLESSHDFEKGLNCHELITPNGRKVMSHDEEVSSILFRSTSDRPQNEISGMLNLSEHAKLFSMTGLNPPRYHSKEDY